MIRYNSTLLHAALVRVYASTIMLHLRSYDLFLLSPTATRRRALVLWVRFTWNEGRGGGMKGKSFICVNNYIAINYAYFFRFKFQAFSLHLLHNAVRGALFSYITLSMIRSQVIFYC